MQSYSVRHLSSDGKIIRPAILVNANQREGIWHRDESTTVKAFHRQLPDYGETKLHSLPQVAAELGLKHVFIKDESTRFGLPSFKILGASWALHRAVCGRLGLLSSSTLAELVEKLGVGSDVRLVTCTEGNWGRAVARMARYLGVAATIYVPGFLNDYTRNLIRSEGADVRVLDGGSYDDTIAAVKHDAATTGALMVMDTSWEGYEEVPGWVSEGYTTMLTETDRQVAALTDGYQANLFFVSVGVGSWAHSVVEHYKSLSTSSRIITVEADTAASFKESLHCNTITPIQTGETIMNGMNCGTTSTIAWPALRDGTFAAVAVDDAEAHECVQYLQDRGVNAGPCGAATLAALRKVCKEGVLSRDELHKSIVVLFSTEGYREYSLPE